MRILFLPVMGVTTFFTLFFIYTKLIGPIPFSVTSVTTQKSTTFDVSEEGKVTVIPDIAVVTVGIQVQDVSVRGVQNQINSVISKVSEAVKKLGVDVKDIKTVNYNINPSYDRSAGSQKITGYSASTNLSIKLRKIDTANEVIDAATAAGANQVGGISFEVDDKTKAENEAREKAVVAAKKKAQDAARIAGFRLGRVINYSENLGGFPHPIPLRMMTEGAPGSSVPTQVEPGSSEISVTITLSYEIL